MILARLILILLNLSFRVQHEWGWPPREDEQRAQVSMHRLHAAFPARSRIAGSGQGITGDSHGGHPRCQTINLSSHI